jgi:hypothetical protein
LVLSVDAVWLRFCIESEDALFELILGLGSAYFSLLRHIQWNCLIGSLPPAFETAAWIARDDTLWAGVSDLVRKSLDFADRRPLLAPAGFSSLMVAELPVLFSEFHGKSLTLLWRGSRDGFGADDFHGRCDGHAPTLTLIEDTEGNIFGGFTPVKWESGEWQYKADPSLKGEEIGRLAFHAGSPSQALRRYPEITAIRQCAGGFQPGSRAPTSVSESDQIPKITGHR